MSFITALIMSRLVGQSLAGSVQAIVMSSRFRKSRSRSDTVVHFGLRFYTSSLPSGLVEPLRELTVLDSKFQTNLNIISDIYFVRESQYLAS